MGQVMALLKAFALAGASEATFAIRDDTRFFSDIRSYKAKLDKEGNPGQGGSVGSDALDTAISQLISETLAAEEVIDIYAQAGL
jgi:type I restriction enzyme R subunit